jgi:hypothetical protein
VQDLRFFVEHLADAMAAVFANHRETVLFGVLLDHFADIAQTCARLDQLDALYMHSWVIFDRRSAHSGTLADVEHAAGVAVVTVLDDGHVDVQHVAFLQRFSFGMPWQTTWLIEVQMDFGKPL